MRQFVLFCIVMLMSSAGVSAQQRSDDVPFNGMVIDAFGKGIARVNIWVKDSDRRTMTDKKGRFGMLNVDEEDVLVFSRKGFRVELPVAQRKSLSVMIVDQHIVAADECPALVDVGYGYIRRHEYNSSCNVVTGDELRQSAIIDLETALVGRVPGLVRMGSELTLRGRNSISLSSKPLILVDGSEVDNLSMVNIYDVETVTVLKDGGIYGARGANGVILVKTISQ